MASQVLSGASNPSYTNNTGQNVRVVINYMDFVTSISWAGVSASVNACTIGRNLAYTRSSGTVTTVNSEISIPRTLSSAPGVLQEPLVNIIKIPVAPSSDSNNMGETTRSLPTELMLAPGQTFSATCRVYNIVIIPEAG